MSPKEFLREFGHLAETEGGLSKLRQMVLELAVAGRFSESKDGWKESTLATAGKWAIGSGFPKNAQGRDDLPLLFCKVSDMNLPGNEVEIRSTVHTIDHELAKAIRAKLHPEGTIIFPKIGGAIATNKRRKLVQPTAIDNNCLGITPAKDCSSDFLLTVLWSIDFTRYQVGTSVPALSQGVIGEIPILLPPLPEQKRIVEKVDQLMALCDELEAKQKQKRAKAVSLNNAALSAVVHAPDKSKLKSSWSRVQDHFEVLYELPENVKELRQTILQLAVMGKLVRQEEGDEPASGQLERVRHEKERLLASGGLRKSLVSSSDDESRHAVPSGWEWISLTDIAEVADPNPSHRMPRYVESGVPFISTENFVDEETIDFLRGKKVPPEELVSQMERFEIRPGAFALSRIGTIGKTVTLPTERSYCMSHSLCVISPFSAEVLSSFLRLVVTSPAVIRQAHRGVKSIGTPDLGVGKIRAFHIPWPPPAEQVRIVHKVRSLVALCDDLEGRLTQHRDQGQRLMQAVVEGLVA